MGNQQGKQRNFAKDAKLKIKYPTVDTAYILGVFLTDGCVQKTAFILRTIDKDFCETILRHLDNIIEGGFNHNIVMQTETYDNRESTKKYKFRPIYKISVSSVELCQWLNEVTKFKQCIPDEYLDGSKEIQLALLAGLMDGDGSVAKHGTNTYKILLCGHQGIYGCVKDYERLIAKLGMKYFKREQTTKPDFYYHQVNTKSFLECGGYCQIKRKADRLATQHEYYGVPSTTKMTNTCESV